MHSLMLGGFRDLWPTAVRPGLDVLEDNSAALQICAAPRSRDKAFRRTILYIRLADILLHCSVPCQLDLHA